MLEELKRLNDLIIHVQERMSVLSDNIKREFDLPRLKDQLLALPEQTKKTQITALQKKSELTEIEQQMKQCEAGISFEINSELGANEKPKFSNENLRKAELTKRSSEDKGCQLLRTDRLTIELKLWELEAETDRLRNEFRARVAVKDLIVAELNLYTK